MSLSYDIFDVVVNLKWHWLISFNITVALALTLRALKLPFNSYPFLTILRITYHFSRDTVPASRIPAAYHKNRLPVCHVEPVAAIKAI
jgi:hypothetical protein